MTTIRVKKKTRDYVVMQKQCLNDKSLSWGARGLHAFLLAQADSWQTSISGLVVMGTAKKHAVGNFLKELINQGYVERYTERSERGMIQKVGYIVYEERECKALEPNNQDQVNSLDPNYQLTDNQLTDNQPLISNKNIINNKQKKKEATSSFIDKKLSEDQLAIVKQKTDGMFEKLTTEFSLEEWVVGVTEELINVNSFKKTNQEFKHKLNIILKMANNGSWCPRARLECKANEDFKKVESSRNELRYLIRVKQGEIASFKRYIPHLTGDHKQKNEIAIKKAEKELKDLMLTLHEVKEAA